MIKGSLGKRETKTHFKKNLNMIYKKAQLGFHHPFRFSCCPTLKHLILAAIIMFFQGNCLLHRHMIRSVTCPCCKSFTQKQHFGCARVSILHVQLFLSENQEKQVCPLFFFFFLMSVLITPLYSQSYIAFFWVLR